MVVSTVKRSMRLVTSGVMPLAHLPPTTCPLWSPYLVVWSRYVIAYSRHQLPSYRAHRRPRRHEYYVICEAAWVMKCELQIGSRARVQAEVSLVIYHGYTLVQEEEHTPSSITGSSTSITEYNMPQDHISFNTHRPRRSTRKHHRVRRPTVKW